jgi:NAD(P)-dependent dehydrogenase (short-subunit alcohol dehydrogenase family)
MPGAIEEGANPPPVVLDPTKFKGQVVVITGAAQGIAKTTSKLFAKQGAQVVLVDIQAKQVESVAAEIKAEGGSAAFRATDLSDPQQCKDLIQSIIEEFKKIDVLVQLAVHLVYKPVTEITTKELVKSQEVNAWSILYLAQAVLPHMRKAGYGRLIQTSTATTQHLFKGLFAYVASKGSVETMTRSLAIEAGPGITSNLVMPGFVETPGAAMGNDATTQHVSTAGDMWDYHIAKQCVKRRGQPEDLGYAICFLASPEASFISGQILDVSGGFTFH